MKIAQRLEPIVGTVLIAAGLLCLSEAFGAQTAVQKPPTLSEDSLRQIDAAIPSTPMAQPKEKRRLLVFWRCEGFFHGDGIAAANHALKAMGLKTGAYTADFSDNYQAFELANLQQYDVVVLNNTTQLKLSQQAKNSLLDFVRQGGGLVGIHAATDNFYDWHEGAAMLGGLFDGHPWGADGTWAFQLDDPAHVLNRAWKGKGFKLQDEIYQFKSPYSRSDRRVLVSLDLADPATGAVQNGINRKDKDFAVAWIKQEGKGRVFYCSLGHAANVFQDPGVLRFYLDGIQYATGDLEADASHR